jgi:BON domain
MKPLNTIKLSTLAVAFAFSSSAFSATSDDTFTNNDWQSSMAQEFSGLDESGNGLLLPHEASKGKAFNKKSFAAADKDADGTIDQNEYIQHKTNMGATNQPSASQPSSGTSTESMSSIDSISDQPEPLIQTAEMSQDSADTKKRTVGVVIDDSVITTKAKAAIFNTPDLKTLQISVETRKGEVVLSGFVDNEAAKVKAEEVVRNVGGVTSVTNNLEVKT